MLTITLDDNSIFDIKLNSNPVGQYIEKSFKHLQHLPLPTKIYDYPAYYVNDKDLLYTTLIDSAKKLNIDIDVSKLVNQEYLNYLHEIYEHGYKKGTNVWLDFHEMIHSIEKLNNGDIIDDQIIVNYRDAAGLLEKPFDRNYLQYAVQNVSAGTCYCRWSELGKHPYQYWLDKEPNDIIRLCQLATPWTILRPSFTIALEDTDLFLSKEELQEFNTWFSEYKDQWIQHWNLKSWDEKEMNSVIPIGEILDVSTFKEKIHKGARIYKVNVR
jgi:hypothetical protein